VLCESNAHIKQAKQRGSFFSVLVIGRLQATKNMVYLSHFFRRGFS
jgi:hypothetical protein